jgi:hypothetical protein
MIHGSRAVSVPFTAESDQSGSVRGVVTFIEYGGATFSSSTHSYRRAFRWRSSRSSMDWMKARSFVRDNGSSAWSANL